MKPELLQLCSALLDEAEQDGCVLGASVVKWARERRIGPGPALPLALACDELIRIASGPYAYNVASIRRMLAGRCDGDHAGPECGDRECWHRDEPVSRFPVRFCKLRP